MGWLCGKQQCQRLAKCSCHNICQLLIPKDVPAFYTCLMLIGVMGVSAAVLEVPYWGFVTEKSSTCGGGARFGLVEVVTCWCDYCFVQQIPRLCSEKLWEGCFQLNAACLSVLCCVYLAQVPYSLATLYAFSKAYKIHQIHEILSEVPPVAFPIAGFLISTFGLILYAALFLSSGIVTQMLRIWGESAYMYYSWFALLAVNLLLVLPACKATSVISRIQHPHKGV
ncbi:hypothetical protein Pelo_11617 [Pelomyxa schiedti]|nr:hypothetical protein Pelo_11617 [Pelomyxa schiedti]